MDDARFDAGVTRLRTILQRARQVEGLLSILNSKDRVLARYGRIFASSNLDNITEDDYRSFLRLENNCHWSQLYRGGDRAANNIRALREGLRILLDEGHPVAERFNRVQVAGLGNAIKSAILLVAYPDRYGVWNNTSEKGLSTLGLFPQQYPKKDKGKTYEAMNQVLGELSNAIGTDLWTLDALWWAFDERRSSRVAKQLTQL